MKRVSGFTLLEVLMVMVVIGILAGISFSLLSDVRARAAVRETAQQIAADLNRARSSAQRASRDTSLVLASNGRSYALTLSGNTTTLNLPAGLTAQSVGTSLETVSYMAPFGELAGAGRIWKVSSAVATVYIKTIGVTGKVAVYAN